MRGEGGEEKGREGEGKRGRGREGKRGRGREGGEEKGREGGEEREGKRGRGREGGGSQRGEGKMYLPSQCSTHTAPVVFSLTTGSQKSYSGSVNLGDFSIRKIHASDF